MDGIASSSSHSSFCEEVFSACSWDRRSGPAVIDRGYSNRMRWTGQIFWLPGLWCLYGTAPSSRLHPRNFRRLAQWEVVSSYSSATAPDSHGISCADPLFQARKELDQDLPACATGCKTYLITCKCLLSCRVL